MISGCDFLSEFIFPVLRNFKLVVITDWIMNILISPIIFPPYLKFILISQSNPQYRLTFLKVFSQFCNRELLVTSQEAEELEVSIVSVTVSPNPSNSPCTQPEITVVNSKFSNTICAPEIRIPSIRNSKIFLKKKISAKFSTPKMFAAWEGELP
jgi:hypothetical protein